MAYAGRCQPTTIGSAAENRYIQMGDLIRQELTPANQAILDEARIAVMASFVPRPNQSIAIMNTLRINWLTDCIISFVFGLVYTGVKVMQEPSDDSAFTAFIYSLIA
ncbi:MAG: hypothetical protein WC763_06270 [Candidatus Paceibacterota bacterium]|jgi:hypothetical protein